MEPVFVWKALRRYWWLFFVCVLIGTTAGALGSGGGPPSYNSTALILMAPPGTSLSSSGTSDRYVAGQMAVLTSESTAMQVAALLGDGSDPQAIAASVSVAQAPSSDVVQLTVASESPARAQSVANAYVEVYFAALGSQIEDTLSANLEGVDDRLAELDDQIKEVDRQIADAMEPYLPRIDAESGAFPPLPPIEQVVPDLVSRKQTLLNQYQTVDSAKSQIELGSNVRIGSQIVQQPTLPTIPVVSSGRRAIAAGMVGGALVGVVLAVVAARVSRRVLDHAEVEEIIGSPVVASIPRYRVPTDRREILTDIPVDVVPLIDHLRVRCDAVDRERETLVVAVTGTEVGIGTTTLAAALANRFAKNGATVVIVDADPVHSEFAELFPSDVDELDDIDRLLVSAGMDAIDLPDPGARGAADIPEERVDIDLTNPRALPRPRCGLERTTPVDNIAVLAASDVIARRAVLRRDDPARVLESVSERSVADVILIDGGPLLGAASTLQFAHLADVTVLAVPLERQARDALSTIAAQLNMQQNVLPVVMPRVRRARR